MPFLQLQDLRTGKMLEFERSPVRLGRDPNLDVVVEGEGAGFVSALHATVDYRDNHWWLADAGSRNGTFLNEKQAGQGERLQLSPGVSVGLGRRGPRFRVIAVAPRVVEETIAEGGPAPISPDAPTERMAPPPPGAAPPSPPPSRPPAPPRVVVVLRVASTGELHRAEGVRLRMGRGTECELRPVVAGETSISRVHAEVVLQPDGRAVVRDAGSRNGTLVDGKRIVGDRVLAVGQRLQLGPGTAELEVVEAEVLDDLAPGKPTSRPAAPAAPAPPAAPTTPPVRPGRKEPPRGNATRRSYGGKGQTRFFRELFDESSRRSARRVRWLVWTFVVVVIGAAGGLYWYSEQRVRETEARLAETQQVVRAQQVFADSVQREASAEYERLRAEFEAATARSAPTAVVESLRVALDEARDRTAALETALSRAQASLTQQLEAGDSLRREAEAELTRLQGQLTSAQEGGVAGGLLDSLRAAVRDAQDRAGDIESRLRAVSGFDLAAVAQANQAAVGLVTAYFGADVFDGSGFVLTPSGYFVTNRHVVRDEARVADSIFITLADERTMRPADLVEVAELTGPDLAVLQIRRYDGPHVPRIDWSGRHVRQGEPAALIGFPKGFAAALDVSRTIRTSMSAGIFSKVTPETIQFDGFTVGGSSGSPIFNANGEVVAVHRAGLRDATGLAFAVPIPHLVGLLPEDARREAGIAEPAPATP